MIQATKKHFEQQSDDKFIVTCTEGLRELNKAYIWHGGEGMFAAWHLASVEVEHTTSNRLWRFEVNDWVAKSSSADGAMSFVAQVRLQDQLNVEHYQKTSALALPVGLQRVGRMFHARRCKWVSTCSRMEFSSTKASKRK